MIPYAELERAIARWKVRQAGGEPAAAAASDGGRVREASAAGADTSDAAAAVSEAYHEVSSEQLVLSDSSGLTYLTPEAEEQDDGQK